MTHTLVIRADWNDVLSLILTIDASTFAEGLRAKNARVKTLPSGLHHLQTSWMISCPDLSRYLAAGAFFRLRYALIAKWTPKRLTWNFKHLICVSFSFCFKPPSRQTKLEAYDCTECLYMLQPYNFPSPDVSQPCSSMAMPLSTKQAPWRHAGITLTALACSEWTQIPTKTLQNLALNLPRRTG